MSGQTAGKETYVHLKSDRTFFYWNVMTKERRRAELNL